MQAVHEDVSAPVSIKEEPMPERTLDEMLSIEPTFSQHEAITGIPFSASFFKLDKVYNDIDLKDRTNIKKLDDFIKSKVDNKEISDDATSVGSYIKNIQEKIGLKDYHDPYYKLEKLSNYLSATNKYESHEKVKNMISSYKYKKVASKNKELTKKIGNKDKIIDKLRKENTQLKTGVYKILGY